MENICFRDQSFLNQATLTESNVLDYFSTSHFYDPLSNNEILKMQTKYTDIEINDFTLKLANMIGTQYILHDHNEERTLFIIKFIERFSPDDYETLKIYYVMFGNIYMCPSNFALYESRLCNFYYFLNNVLDSYETCITYDGFGGIKEKSAVDMKVEMKAGDNELFYRVLNEFKLEKNEKQV